MADDQNKNQPFESKNEQEEHKETKETNYMKSVEEMIHDSSDSNLNEEDIQHNRSKKEPPSKNKTWLYVLVSGITGGVVSAAIIIIFIMNGAIPTQETSQSLTAAEEDNQPEVVQTIGGEDKEISSSIEDASRAIVGVANLQQRSIWEQSEEAGAGSGIIYKKEGDTAYVVTNQHVVDGAEEVEIVMPDEERIPAKVLGTDPLTDLAVLEMDGKNIDTVASLGASDDLRIGETVVAIGNPLGMNFNNTLTRGIVSGLDRSVPVDTNGDGNPDWITEVIQTDAAINPGNSGGALVNAEGEVIGINSMKVARQEVEGIGFAIPIDAAIPVMEQLESSDEIERPIIGITTASLNQVPPQYHHEIALPEEVEGGMVVADVLSGSAADNAGLQQFDVITKINGQEVTSILELRQFLYSDTSIGETVEIEFYREGNLETAELTLQAEDESTEM
ncbi:S1C family serine protease [Virgibacillus oceani]